MEFNFWNIISLAIFLFIIYNIGYLRGWRMREITAQRYIDDILAKKKEEALPIMVKISKVGDVFHIHKEDDTFVATVTDVKDANEKLQKLFPGKTVLVKQKNAKEEGFV